jgi:hypothetical protein
MNQLRTANEEQVGKDLASTFECSKDSVETRLLNFPKYSRRKSVTRFLALYELFKQVIDVKGSIVECGVHQGFGLMTWAHLSAVLEPANLTRRIYGFDTFAGFPAVSDRDANRFATAQVGQLQADVYTELVNLIRLYDQDRFLGHVDKVHLIKGNATETIPAFIDQNPHVLVSLLYLDFDLYEPTQAALAHLLPRMPSGAVVAFDELDNPIWPGETVAAVQVMASRRLKIQRFSWDPYVGYAVLD